MVLLVGARGRRHGVHGNHPPVARAMWMMLVWHFVSPMVSLLLSLLAWMMFRRVRLRMVWVLLLLLMLLLLLLFLPRRMIGVCPQRYRWWWLPVVVEAAVDVATKSLRRCFINGIMTACSRRIPRRMGMGPVELLMLMMLLMI